MEQQIENFQKYTDIVANLIVIIGAVPVIIWLRNRAFESKKKEIKDNLSVRKSIHDKLVEHANGYDRSKPHDIGIRLVYWKNYPWKLEDDGYKQLLYYDTNMDKVITDRGDEFLTNTGILLDEHIWFFDLSLYLGKYGIYLIDKSNKKIAGFEEITQRIKLVRTLKYKHIINWDFEELIEYEPVFYMRYKYTDKRLYEDDLIAQNYDDVGSENHTYIRHKLSRRNKVRSNHSLKYRYLMLKGRLHNK
jgi:hypothetical protein